MHGTYVGLGRKIKRLGNSPESTTNVKIAVSVSRGVDLVDSAIKSVATARHKPARPCEVSSGSSTVR